MTTTTSSPGYVEAAEASGYHTIHHHRINLLVHAVTVPIFMAGTLATVVAVFTGPWWLAVISLAAMAAAIGAQGASHQLEASPPEPFHGPLDVIGVLFVEQWVKFPRHVLGGGFRREWRRSGPRERKT